MILFKSSDSILIGRLKTLLESSGIPSEIRDTHHNFDNIDTHSNFELVLLDTSQFQEANNILEASLKKDWKTERPWTCKKCREKIEGQFTHCWNCSTPRDQ